MVKLSSQIQQKSAALPLTRFSISLAFSCCASFNIFSISSILWASNPEALQHTEGRRDLGWKTVNTHAWKPNTDSGKNRGRQCFLHKEKTRSLNSLKLHKTLNNLRGLAWQQLVYHSHWAHVYHNMLSREQSAMTLLVGDGADLSVPMETEPIADFPVSHLSGVQAELPVETLVSMLSELSRLRVSYAWLPLGGAWWCKMERWTVGDRSVGAGTAVTDSQRPLLTASTHCYLLIATTSKACYAMVTGNIHCHRLTDAFSLLNGWDELYLCSAEPTVSESPCLRCGTSLSASTVTPEKPVESITCVTTWKICFTISYLSKRSAHLGGCVFLMSSTTGARQCAWCCLCNPSVRFGPQ